VAEGLLAFEAALRRAEAAMDGWRTPGTERVWQECRRGLDEALSRAHRLRVEAPALDYEALVAVLADLMDPLAAFEAAARLLGGR
jgi:hypothetical protein